MGKKRRLFTLIPVLFIFILVVSLTSCGTKTTNTPQHSVSTVPSKTTLPTEVVSSPVSPVDTKTTASSESSQDLDIVAIPTPKPGYGVVVGTIGKLDESQRVWEISGKIYLAPLLYAKDQSGDPVIPILGLDLKEDKSTELHSGRKFFFDNVEPGKYGIILNNPLENYPVPGSHSSGFLIVTVEDGQMADAGEISPPENRK